MKFTSFDKAVLMEKAIILNGLIANGDKEERKRAKIQFEKEVLPYILTFTNVNKNTETEGRPFF
ncbi:hypothetical protein ACOMCU_16350 [Lysinibacillus sp. UGB7]|uniref:hypothetical protein n=1 Tax=Lysinibacillus sp. UGB7 TaxID=3411039 RepID=UPI003B80AA71